MGHFAFSAMQTVVLCLCADVSNLQGSTGDTGTTGEGGRIGERGATGMNNRCAINTVCLYLLSFQLVGDYLKMNYLWWKSLRRPCLTQWHS